MQSKNRIMALSFIIAACLLAMLSFAIAQEKKIDVKDLPSTVTAAFQKAYPKATIVGTATEVEDGKTMYEVESKDGVINRDLLYTDKGEIFEIEESVTSESLPADVKTALEKQFPKYSIKKGEKVSQGAKVEYDLTVVSDKKIYSVTVDGNAKITKSEVVKEKKEKKEKNEKKEKDEKDVKDEKDEKK